ncbi:MAG: tetratricopeptide repeat protein [Gemmataceae bacterium]
MRIRDRRVRAALAVVLLGLIGVAVYFAISQYLAKRQYDLARAALERCDFQEALQHLDEYLQRRPTDGAALVLAAQAARRSGDLADADRRLRLAFDQGADADELAVEHDLLRVQIGHLAAAERLAAFCKKNPAGPETGLALEALIEGGMRAFHLALAAWSVDFWLEHRFGSLDQTRGLLWRGRLYEMSEDFGQALLDFRKAAELSPEFVPARLALAEALLRAEPRQAVSEVEWLTGHAARNPDVRFVSARLRRALGRPEEAGVALDELLTAQPKRVDALVERGRVALDRGRAEEAEPWLRKAEKLAPEQRDVNVALADCLRLAGKLEEAKTYQDKAKEIQDRLEKALEELRKAEKK